MIVRPACLALLVAATWVAGACVSETVSPPTSEWTLTGEPEVLVDGEIRPLDEIVDGGGESRLGELGDEDLLSLLGTDAGDLEPDFLAGGPRSPFHRLGRDTVRGIDGSWSKVYSLRSGMGQKVVQMLTSMVPGFPVEAGQVGGSGTEPGEAISWALHNSFHSDPTEKFGIRNAIASGQVADVLVVQASPEVLLFIDELLHKVLADLPQIEIEVRIVEVNLDDLVEWDSNVRAAKLENRDSPYDPVLNPPDGNFGAGIPILDPDGSATGLGGAFTSFADTTASATSFLLSLQGVHNGLRVDAILNFLQSISAAQLISAPTVTVLNGHRATLTTGDRVPIFESTGVGTNSQVTTRFEDTGVNVEIVPFILSDDIIRIDVSVDVSLVTGEVPFVLSGVEVATPIISERKAGTTVHVHSGQVFSIGGLRSSANIETISKVPLLGDIPLIGWLFKSRASRQQSSEIVFFITPRISVPSETLFEPLDG